MWAPVYDADARGTLGAEAAVALAKKDGVTRLEIGYDVWTITQGRSAEELTRLMAGVFASAPNIEWIAQISMSRHCSISALTRWLAPFLQLDTYQTLDLSGDELAQPIENIRPLYRVAKDKGLRLKAHVGE
jgi:adenosine deaminase